MNEDLISNNFVDSIDKAIVKRNFIISKLLLGLCILWSVIMLIDWYVILRGGSIDMIEGTKMVYTYIIFPIADVIIFGLSVYSYFLILKAYRCIDVSIDQSNGNLMSEGFGHFYTSNVLTVICFLISIISTLMNFLL